jgi:hypothetical protein
VLSATKIACGVLSAKYIGVGRGSGGANDPLWKKIFEIDREIPLTRIVFFKIDRENLEFLTKRPPLCKSWLRL